MGTDQTNSSECQVSIRNRVTLDAMWYAGTGIDFTLEAWDSRFHIQPAVEYYGLAVQAEGDFGRLSTGTFINAQGQPQVTPDLEENAGAVGDAEIYHGIAASLSLGVEVFEDGPYRWLMFVQGRYVRMLNDPRTIAQGPLVDGNVVTYKAGLDQKIYQIHGGFTIQYTGLD